MNNELVESITTYGDLHFVWLKFGYKFLPVKGYTALSYHFFTVNDQSLIPDILNTVQPCTCDECTICTKTHVLNRLGQGRKALPIELKTVVATVRLTPSRKIKLKVLGSKWLSEAIDSSQLHLEF